MNLRRTALLAREQLLPRGGVREGVVKPVHRPRLTCRHCGLPKRSFLSSASARGPARAGQAVTTVSSVRLGPRGAKAPEARAQVSGHTCCGTGRRRPSGRRCGGLHGRAAAFRGAARSAAAGGGLARATAASSSSSRPGDWVPAALTDGGRLRLLRRGARALRDGCSVGWAAARFLCRSVRCRGLRSRALVAGTSAVGADCGGARQEGARRRRVPRGARPGSGQARWGAEPGAGPQREQVRGPSADGAAPRYGGRPRSRW